MEKENKRDPLTAATARSIARDSSYTINHIYKMIRECASNNLVRTNWDVMDTDPEVVVSIMKELKLNGYTVHKETDNRGNCCSLDIRW